MTYWVSPRRKRPWFDLCLLSAIWGLGPQFSPGPSSMNTHKFTLNRRKDHYPWALEPSQRVMPQDGTSAGLKTAFHKMRAQSIHALPFCHYFWSHSMIFSRTWRTSRKNVEKTKPVLIAFCSFSHSSSIVIRTGDGSYFYVLQKDCED